MSSANCHQRRGCPVVTARASPSDLVAATVRTCIGKGVLDAQRRRRRHDRRLQIPSSLTAAGDPKIAVSLGDALPHDWPGPASVYEAAPTRFGEITHD